MAIFYVFYYCSEFSIFIFVYYIISVFTLTLECKVVECQNTVSGFRVVGEILGVLAEESVLDEKGRVDPTKLNAFVFDQFQSGYYAIGEKVGQAWSTGAKLMK